jgi:transposase
MFLPPYSSELNPIERLWSVLKRKWTQNLQIYVDELSNVR